MNGAVVPKISIPYVLVRKAWTNWLAAKGYKDEAKHSKEFWRLFGVKEVWHSINNAYVVEVDEDVISKFEAMIGPYSYAIIKAMEIVKAKEKA